jgi:hypothetical protein
MSSGEGELAAGVAPSGAGDGLGGGVSGGDAGVVSLGGGSGTGAARSVLGVRIRHVSSTDVFHGFVDRNPRIAPFQAPVGSTRFTFRVRASSSVTPREVQAP